MSYSALMAMRGSCDVYMVPSRCDFARLRNASLAASNLRRASVRWSRLCLKSELSDAREGGRPGLYRGAGAGAASSYGTRAASGKAGAASSSEDSLLELLELLLLLIV